MPHVGTLEDHGTSGLSKLQCQIIAALDVRIMNADRHGANILVTNGKESSTYSALSSSSISRGIVPIDHGYALPALLEEPMHLSENNSDLEGTTFIWQGYRQCRDPILPKCNTSFRH